MIKIIDNFLSERAYRDLIAQIACGPFVDYSNPSDGYTYPNICKYIPNSVTGEVNLVAGGEYIEFLRASPEGVNCPHPVHHDGLMGRLTMILYTGNVGGTAIMAHKEKGIMYAPTCDDMTAIIERDKSDIEKWVPVCVAEAKPNRIAIFDSKLIHSAMPFGGHGEGVDARTVYTRFTV